MPNSGQYDMSYYSSDSGSLSGGIATLRLPTGGKQAWTYQWVDMPSVEPAGFPDLDWSQTAFAVATKSIYLDDDDATPHGTWTYKFKTIGNPPLPPDEEKRVTEGSSTSTSQFCFDRDTGFVSRQRVLAGGSPGNSDILRVFEPEQIGSNSTGRVATELVYGGDDQGSMDNLYGSLCDMTLPDQAQFETHHTYDHGVLKASTVVDPCDESKEILKPVDQDIDSYTGLVKTSRDSAGVATQFGYDVMNRQTSVHPPQSAWTHIAYEFPTTSQPNKVLRVTTSSCPPGQWTCGTPLSWGRSTYDGLGRRTLEERQYPGTGASEIVTDSRTWTYNALGWTLSESVWGNANKKTVFSGHDRFGRVGNIQPPGANPAVEISYDGEGAVTRKTWITTQADGTRSANWTTEVYDSFGRLASVCETQNRLDLVL